MKSAKCAIYTFAAIEPNAFRTWVRVFRECKHRRCIDIELNCTFQQPVSFKQFACKSKVHMQVFPQCGRWNLDYLNRISENSVISELFSDHWTDNDKEPWIFVACRYFRILENFQYLPYILHSIISSWLRIISVEWTELLIETECRNPSI